MANLKVSSSNDSIIKPLNPGSPTQSPSASGISAADGSQRIVESSPQSSGVDPRAAEAQSVQNVEASGHLDESVVEAPDNGWWFVNAASAARNLISSVVFSSPKLAPVSPPASLVSPSALALSDAEEGKVDQNLAENGEKPSEKASNLSASNLTDARSDLPAAMAQVAAMNDQNQTSAGATAAVSQEPSVQSAENSPRSSASSLSDSNLTSTSPDLPAAIKQLTAMNDQSKNVPSSAVSPTSSSIAASLSSSKDADSRMDWDKGDKKIAAPANAPKANVETTKSKLPEWLSVVLHVAVILFAITMHLIYKNQPGRAPHSK